MDTQNFHALCDDIAAAIGAEWRAVEDDNTDHRILTNSVLKLWIKQNSYGYLKRFVLLAAHSSKRITVSETRTAAAIAADITRRLLPEAQHAQRKQNEYTRKRAAEEARRAELLDRLNRATGGILEKARNSYPLSNAMQIPYPDEWQSTEPRALVSISHDFMIEINLSRLPPLVAEKILTLLVTLHPCTPPTPSAEEEED